MGGNFQTTTVSEVHTFSFLSLSLSQRENQGQGGGQVGEGNTGDYKGSRWKVPLNAWRKNLASSGSLFTAADAAASEAVSCVPRRGHLSLQLTVSEYPDAFFPFAPAPLGCRTFRAAEVTARTQPGGHGGEVTPKISPQPRQLGAGRRTAVFSLRSVSSEVCVLCHLSEGSCPRS